MDLENEVIKGSEDFINHYIKPHESEIEIEGLPVIDIFKKAGEYGLIAIPLPEKYGGLGLPYKTFTRVAMMLSKYSGTVAMVLGAHLLATYAILIGGNEEQKKEYIPRLARGELIASFALTEPSTGSDPSAITTEAVKDEDSYIINGTKAFITNAGIADIFIVMAKTDRERGARGISAFIVETQDEGISVGKREEFMALPAFPNASLVFNNVRVQFFRLLGSEGTGFITAMKTLDIGRIATGASAVGVSQRALEEAAKYSQERYISGRPISSFEIIQSYIAEMAVSIETARLLVLEAAQKMDEGAGDLPLYAAMAKYYASKVAVDVSRYAVQIFGGYGCTKGYAVERLYREAKMYEIVEGTSEIQKLIISNHILKGVH